MEEQKKSNIGKGTWMILIGTAIFFDVIEALISLIPILGEIIAMAIDALAFATFWLIFKMNDHEYSRRAFLGGFIVGFIPIINMLPECTLSIVMLYFDAKARNALAKVPGGGMVETAIASGNNVQNPKNNTPQALKPQTRGDAMNPGHPNTAYTPKPQTNIVQMPKPEARGDSMNSGHPNTTYTPKPDLPAKKEEYPEIKVTSQPAWFTAMKKSQNEVAKPPAWQEEWMKKSGEASRKIDNASPTSLRISQREREFAEAKRNHFGLDNENKAPKKSQGAYGVDMMGPQKSLSEYRSKNFGLNNENGSSKKSQGAYGVDFMGPKKSSRGDSEDLKAA